jgi:N12 class adenine-specific DNA methylase
MEVIREKNYGIKKFVKKVVDNTIIRKIKSYYDVKRACEKAIEMVQPYSKVAVRKDIVYTDVYLFITQGRNMRKTKIEIKENRFSRPIAYGYVENGNLVAFLDNHNNEVEFLN